MGRSIRKGDRVLKKYKGINLLILSDEDMNCDSSSQDLSKMTLDNIGFSMFAIKDYDIIIYDGKKGSKILKSKYTKKGEIK